MARINLEDQFWLDIMQVAVKFGDLDHAVGNTIRWFRFSQEQHKLGKLISEKDFKDQGFSEHLFPLFAERVEGGIQVRGAAKHFGWLHARQEAGRKGGKSKSPEKLKNLKQNSRSKSEAKESKSNPLTLTLPLTTSSDSHNSSYSTSNSVNTNTVPEAKKLREAIWLSYKESYFLRYQQDPVRNAKVNSQISQLAKRLGAEAPEVVRFFLSHPKSFYVSKLHEIGLCLADAEALRTQWARGKAITERDIKKYQDSQARSELYQAIAEGKI